MHDPRPLLDVALDELLVLDDGARVEWEAIGTGNEPLVWIVGGPGLPAHLARADVEPVLDRFRCHLVNGMGSGRSSPGTTDADYDLERIVDRFEAWRAALRLAPVTVVGHSWGGLVAPAWAALHPGSVGRVIVIDGYAGAGSVDWGEAMAERERALGRHRHRRWYPAAREPADRVDDAVTADEATLVADLRAMLPLYFANPGDRTSLAHIERIRREMRLFAPIVHAWSGHREAADYRPLLARVTCPTLVLVGEHDWICGPTWARSLAAAIPGARLVELADAGHMPQYEAPGVVRAAIDDWLDGED